MSKSYNLLLHSGRFIERVGRQISSLGVSRTREAFLYPEAIQINEARLAHLSSLGLKLENKSVLEVGAGIGLLTQFFLDLGCAVLSTDGRPENVAEIRRRHPRLDAQVLDLDAATDLTHLGEFDIVMCYGTLYHLSQPDRVLGALARICREMILLETCVTPGSDVSPCFMNENRRERNQSVEGGGCRPTRPWIMERLRSHYGHAYVTKMQPRHSDFDLDWVNPLTKPLHRAVFVGSKTSLHLPTLLTDPPDVQAYAVR